MVQRGKGNYGERQVCTRPELKQSQKLFDPRGLPQSRLVVINIFTHVVRPSIRKSPLFKIDQNKTDLHCRSGLWSGRVDH